MEDVSEEDRKENKQKRQGISFPSLEDYNWKAGRHLQRKPQLDS